MPQMNLSGIDVPVLLIFFCRPGPFRQTFEAVKRARPSKLYLYQDGPREGRESDVKGIAECRAIVENEIDWECEVHRFYQKKNVGCDPSEYIAQKWMFETEDKGIVLEDDDVASPSFFPYCKELLERYEHDERMAMICGRNQLGAYNPNGCSYFFSSTGSIWGWATWKRVVDKWEEHYDSLNDGYVLKNLVENYQAEGMSRHIGFMLAQKTDGRAFYETILGLSRFTQNRLCIVPTVNMIRNVGNLAEATHPTTDAGKTCYQLAVEDMTFPIIHPKYVIDDKTYSHLVNDAPPLPMRALNKIKRICSNLVK